MCVSPGPSVLTLLSVRPFLSEALSAVAKERTRQKEGLTHTGSSVVDYLPLPPWSGPSSSVLEGLRPPRPRRTLLGANCVSE